jgi:hypothetical protein
METEKKAKKEKKEKKDAEEKTGEKPVRIENVESKGDSRENKKRKKRRSAGSSDDNEKQKSSTNAKDCEKAANEVPPKRLKRSRPFSGKVIAVSTLADSSAETSPDNFTNVMKLCKEAGAQTSNQVHKKTFCLVASESAVTGATQRVRKAWKKGIPVVDVAWVHYCVDDGCLRPFGDFLVQPNSSPSKKKTKVGAGGTKSAPVGKDAHGKDNAEDEGWSEKIDLGCCCVCHETRATDVTDCEWCVECSVNNAAKAARELK